MLPHRARSLDAFDGRPGRRDPALHGIREPLAMRRGDSAHYDAAITPTEEDATILWVASTG